MFARVSRLVRHFMPEARSFVELVPLADRTNSERIVRHFEKLGFHCEGAPQDANTFSAGASLPAQSGMWQTMKCDIKHADDGSVRYELSDLAARVISQD
jgi:hypothetical protein